MYEKAEQLLVMAMRSGKDLEYSVDGRNYRIGPDVITDRMFELMSGKSREFAQDSRVFLSIVRSINSGGSIALGEYYSEAIDSLAMDHVTTYAKHLADEWAQDADAVDGGYAL